MQNIEEFEVTRFIEAHKKRAKADHLYQKKVNAGLALGENRPVREDALLHAVLHKNAVNALHKKIEKLYQANDELSVAKADMLSLEIEYIREHEKRELRKQIEVMLTMEQRYTGSVGGQYNLSEIGRCFWITRERARQIFDSGLKKISSPRNKIMFKQYKDLQKL
jgi:hypothetical protein